MKKFSVFCLLLFLSISSFIPIYADEFIVEEEPVNCIDYLGDETVLFEQYLNSLMYPGISLYSISDQIMDVDGPMYALYSNFKQGIESIAYGQTTNTTIVVKDNDGVDIDIPISEVNLEQYNTIGYKYTPINCLMNQLMTYLSIDCPHLLYWFDKTAGFTVTRGTTTGVQGDYFHCTYITVSMKISKDYQLMDGSLDFSRIQSANLAIQNAWSIVERHAYESDYEKLSSYKDEILNLTDYNYDAIQHGSPYGDAWQLVWVFDQDPNTKVVCEGYTKAFQYLCDLSYFEDENINCISAWGDLVYGPTSGRHEWNIVTMDDGENYIVDLTNMENGDNLFLVGANGSIESGYRVDVGYKYRYDSNFVGSAYDYLSICSHEYIPDYDFDIPSNLYLELNLGNCFLDPASISSRELTWQSSDEQIVIVDNGLITPLQTGNCVITVSNGFVSKSMDVSIQDEVNYSLNHSTLTLYGNWNLAWMAHQTAPWELEYDYVVIDDDCDIDLSVFENHPIKGMVLPNQYIDVPDLNVDTYYVHSDSELVKPNIVYIESIHLETLGYKVVLDGRIGFRIYFDLDDYVFLKDSYSFELETPKGIQSIPLSDCVKDEEHYYICAYVSAKECMDPITLRFFNGNDVLSSHSYSIYEYANYIMDHYPSSSKEVDIISHLMTYGYYAQLYFNYHTDSLYPSILSLKEMDTSRSYNSNILGSRVILGDVLSLQLFFKEDMTVTVDGQEMKTEHKVLTIYNVKDVYHMYHIQTPMFSVDYSIASYKALSDGSLKDVLNACMMYYSSVYR